MYADSSLNFFHFFFEICSRLSTNAPFFAWSKIGFFPPDFKVESQYTIFCQNLVQKWHFYPQIRHYSELSGVLIYAI